MCASPGWTCGGWGAAGKMFDSVKNHSPGGGCRSRFSLAPGGALAGANFDITANGRIPWAEMRSKALHVTSLRLVGRYDGRTHHLALTTADLNALEARASFKGFGDFVSGDDGELAKVHAELAGKDVALDMPGVFKDKVGYQTVAAALDYFPATRQFDITKLALTAQGLFAERRGHHHAE